MQAEVSLVQAPEGTQQLWYVIISSLCKQGVRFPVLRMYVLTIHCQDCFASQFWTVPQ